MDLTKSQIKVYNLLKKIPKGQVTTYKILAQTIGKPKAWRWLAKILSQNSNLKEIPCFRVIKSNGEVGGYRLGINQKKKLLQKEGVVIKNNKVQNLDSYLFKF